MPSALLECLLRYWRASVADEMALDLSRMAKAIPVRAAAVWAGALPDPATERLRAGWLEHQKEKRRAASDAAEADVTTIPVVIGLKVLNPAVSHGQTINGRRLCVVAGVIAHLAPDGGLFHNGKFPPWIARSHLDPGPADAVVGGIDASDRWLEAHPLSAETWQDVMAWFDGYWSAVTGDTPPDGYVVTDECRVAVLTAQVSGAAKALLALYDRLLASQDAHPLLGRFALGRTEREDVTQEFHLARFAAPRGTMNPEHGLADSQADAVAASTALNEGELLAVEGPPGTGKTTLLQAIVASEVVRAALEDGEPAVVVGASTNNEAVLNINRGMNDLLKDSSATGRPAWARRWVPDAETYGLFLPSANRVQQAREKGFAIATNTGGGNAAGNWSGFPERERDPDYLERARAQWLAACAEGFGDAPPSIERGLELLQSELVRLRDQLSGVQVALRTRHDLDAWWRERTGGGAVSKKASIEGLRSEIAAQRAARGCERQDTLDHLARQRTLVDEADAQAAAEASSDDARLRAAEKDAKDATLLHADIVLALSPVGLLEILAKWMGALRPTASARQCGRARALVAGHPAKPEFAAVMATQDSADWRHAAEEVLDGAKRRFADVGQDIRGRDEARRTKLHAAREELGAWEGRLRRVDDALREADEVWRAKQALHEAKLAEWSKADSATREAALTWAAEYSLKAPTAFGLAELDRLADRTIRGEMFQKAMRYWEGRWILEAEKVQAGGVNLKGGELGVSATLRRWCMLTPCLIITLYSLPRVFSWWAGKDGVLFDFIDLLIIDEAGQVGPHIGAPAFSLARRAVVVGDVHQIEPIVTLTPGVDRGNGERCGLAALWDEGEPNDARVVSSPRGPTPQGSVMRVAQRASAFTSPGMGDEPGVFLTEHRRCRAAIVQYCNDLVYRGRLEAVRPEPEVPPPLPALGWAHVQGARVSKGGSSQNEKEVEAIAHWILAQADRWVDHYRGDPRARVGQLADVVAVLTPFKTQQVAIRRALASLQRSSHHDLGAITVGTVHALQGAQRRVVVFSPTYDGTVAKPFFDRKPNLLNVAVSRAMDSFVVIGDMTLFRRGDGSPSSLLGEALIDRGVELLDVGGNYRFPTELAVTGERISTLERHLEVLNEAVSRAEAGGQVVIVSPFIAMRAVATPPFLDLCRRATGRGAVVQVVADRELVERRQSMRPRDGIAALADAGVVVTEVDKIHCKTLLTRDAIVEGSFNWLSAQRNEGDPYVMHETSWRIRGANAAAAIESAKRELRERGVKLT